MYLGNATSLRQAKPVYVWTQTEVCKWLRRHIPPSQAKVTDIFAEHDITGNTDMS